MIEALQPALVACGIVAGVGYGFAAVIRAYFDGKIGMRLAERGETPPGRPRRSLFTLRQSRASEENGSNAPPQLSAPKP